MIFLHIAKTGGTTLKSSLIDGYKVHNGTYLDTKVKGLKFANHNVRLDNKDDYIFFVRDPLERFVSNFIHQQQRGMGYDTDKHFAKRLPNFTDLELNDVIKNIDKLDLKIGWLYRGIDWTLGGVDNIEKCKNNIFFVGQQESLESDFNRLMTKLGESFEINRTYNNKRPKHLDHLTQITEENRQKLKEFLKADYECIDKLKELGFIK